jgi:hypothetical protein
MRQSQGFFWAILAGSANTYDQIMRRRRRPAGKRVFVSMQRDGSLRIQTPAEFKEAARKVGLSAADLKLARKAIKDAINSRELDTNGRIVLPNLRALDLEGSDT